MEYNDYGYAKMNSKYQVEEKEALELFGFKEGRRAGGECKTRLRLFRKKLHHLLQLPPQA
ncbi:unnamed protein product [Cladocopium goreaui]|uniref:Uncharacterized protein n=1 Tax=Cladocopium goreaui TaxID=2562237 RepID=A0A9P1FWC0_9DINO|nr:unnamed protein product [Cladocopium goreaui]